MLATNEQERIDTTPQGEQAQVAGSTTPQGNSGQREAGSNQAGTTSSTASGSTSQRAGTAGSAANSATYNNTMAALRQAQGLGASFTSDYDTEIAKLYDQIANREKFSYDYSTDPLYAQYRQSYTQAGQQAMRDTIGQATALTGGYDNSYANAVGQQQYDEYLSRLNDVLPELYANAYNYYQGEGNRLNQLYALAGDQRDNAYQRYRDALGDAQYNDALSIQQAMDRAALGDWAAYADMYGEEAAKKAAILSNPQAAWASGMATAEEVYKYTGKYPIGYTPPGAATRAVSGGGDWGGYATGKPGPTPGYEFSGIYAPAEGKEKPKW